MRNKVDNTALEEIYTPAAEGETEPFADESDSETQSEPSDSDQ